MDQIGFILEDCEYCIGIKYVQEIIKMPKNVTQVPNSDDYVVGMINLREKVIPIIDLKEKLNLKTNECKEGEEKLEKKVIIIDFEKNYYGLIIDNVTRVIKVKKEDIKELPMEMHSNMIAKGIIILDEKLVVLLDIEKIIKN